jgi:hypothetical protein
MKEPFKWDSYSDQPALLKDRAYKKQMRKKESKSLLKTISTALITLPISLVMMPFVKNKEIDSSKFFSLGVDFQRQSNLTIQLLDELDADAILVRLKLWEMDSLEELKEFLNKNKKRHITLKILQDREHIEDLELLQKDLTTIFLALDDLVDIFEIGSTINRAKWGFFSVDEYNRFFKVAYDLKQSKFENIKLIGSGVIDFEYHFTAHTLFNFCNYRYDGVSSLLYVDRRGAPENTQLGFSLSDKIALLSSMVRLSPKTPHKLYITETNWPLSNTAPYAPTSEYECIDENSYANFMLRYYLLAFASQQVDAVSWHQLLARGYGLVDDVEGMRKREAFYTFKFMLKTLKNAQFLRLDIKRDYYIFQCLIDETLLQIHWSLKEKEITNEDGFEVYSRDGKKVDAQNILISDAPTYIYITKAIPKKVNCIG